jgi:hypothetical protein
MKTAKKNQQLNLWDAFVEFMNSLYFEGYLETLTTDEFTFEWEEFKEQH